MKDTVTSDLVEMMSALHFNAHQKHGLDVKRPFVILRKKCGVAAALLRRLAAGPTGQELRRCIVYSSCGRSLTCR